MGVQVGHVIASKYRLLAQIGEGGMGSVWSGVHELLDRAVAIKFLHAPKSGGMLKERFLREARSAAKVKSRYVADVFDYGVTDDGVPYMVQELLEGEDLGAQMFHGPAWDVRDVVRFMCQCLTALEAVHEKGVVHCDVKPENVFVARDAEGPFPKLLDFGICSTRLADDAEPALSPSRGKKKKARLRARESTELRARAITEGTPAYMAPEQLRGLPLDGRADLYSVGVILYEWLSGRLPYEQSTPEELCAHIAARSALPLSALRPELGDALSGLVARALAPEPAGRFADAAAMRAALLELLPRLAKVPSIVKESVHGAPIGTKTERILTAASCPFGEEPVRPEDEPKLLVPSFWQSRSFRLVGGVAALATLACLGVPQFLPSAELTRTPRVRAAAHVEARDNPRPRNEKPRAQQPVALEHATLVEPAAPTLEIQAGSPTVLPSQSEPAASAPPPAAAVPSIAAVQGVPPVRPAARVARPAPKLQAAAKPLSEPVSAEPVTADEAPAPPAPAAPAPLQPIEDVRLEMARRQVEAAEQALEERPLDYDVRNFGL